MKKIEIGTVYFLTFSISKRNRYRPLFIQATPVPANIHIRSLQTNSLFLKYISLIRSNVISESRLFSSFES